MVTSIKSFIQYQYYSKRNVLGKSENSEIPNEDEI